jgi:HlyD family secretion protein
MDRAISKAEINSAFKKKITKFGIIIISTFILIYFIMTLFKPAINRNELLLAKTFRGNIEETLFSIGTIVPRFEESIISPIETKIEAINLPIGSKVNINQSILELDKTQIISNLNKLKDEYELKKNKESQLKLNLEKDLIELKSQSEIKDIEIESLVEKKNQEKKLYKIGASSSESLKIASLKLEIAKKELKLIKNKIKNQEESLLVDLNEIRLESQILNRNINEINRKIKQASVFSSINGIVSWVDETLGKRVNSGDVLAKVTAEHTFKLKGELSGSNANKIYVGQEIYFEINDKKYRGSIISINPSVNDGLVSYNAKIPENIEEMRANLKLDVHIVLSKKENVIMVKSSSFFTGEGTQGLFFVTNNVAKKRRVELGVSNSEFIELKSHAKENETVIISNLEDYLHLDEIEIK